MKNVDPSPVNSIDFIKNIDGIEYTENNENKNDGILNTCQWIWKKRMRKIISCI